MTRPRPGPQRRARFSRRAPPQRHARLDHRCRRPAVPQGTGQGGAALVHGPCADGEPQRAGGRRGGDPRLGARRAAGRAGLDRAPCGAAATADAGRRQGLPQHRLRHGVARAGGHPRTSLRTTAGGVQRSTGVPPAIPATRPRSASASASKRPSAGPRRWPGGASCGTADCPRSIGNSP
jgi:hypothetical protein